MEELEKAKKLGKISSYFLEAIEELRQENLALRTALRRQGLSDSALQRRVNGYRKGRAREESALAAYERCFAKMLEHFAEIDLAEEVAKLPPPKQVH